MLYLVVALLLSACEKPIAYQVYDSNINGADAYWIDNDHVILRGEDMTGVEPEWPAGSPDLPPTRNELDVWYKKGKPGVFVWNVRTGEIERIVSGRVDDLLCYANGILILGYRRKVSILRISVGSQHISKEIEPPRRYPERKEWVENRFTCIPELIGELRRIHGGPPGTLENVVPLRPGDGYLTISEHDTILHVRHGKVTDTGFSRNIVPVLGKIRYLSYMGAYYFTSNQLYWDDRYPPRDEPERRGNCVPMRFLYPDSRIKVECLPKDKIQGIISSRPVAVPMRTGIFIVYWEKDRRRRFGVRGAIGWWDGQRLIRLFKKGAGDINPSPNGCRVLVTFSRRLRWRWGRSIFSRKIAVGDPSMYFRILDFCPPKKGSEVLGNRSQTGIGRKYLRSLGSFRTLADGADVGGQGDTSFLSRVAE